MGIKSALVQNFYMDSNEVIDAGERIRSVMATVDGCMEEADGLFCRISALAESVPVKARCGALISACENARAGIKKADFLEYGNRVSQNMFELVDYSEYVSNETIKRMEDIRERLGSIRNTVAGLNDLLEFRVYKSNPDRTRANMKQAVQKNSTIGEKRSQNKTLQELREIYGRGYEEETEYELTTSYLAARLARIGVYGNGQPSINSGAEYLAYAECYRKIESGAYSNAYIASKLAQLDASKKGEPSIQSATESDRYFYYFNRLQQNVSYSFGLSSEGIELLKGLELADYHLEDVGVYDESGNLIGMMPYYVMIDNRNGTHSDDGGITIGWGHHISAAEWEDKANSDYQLLAQYVSENVAITGVTVKNSDLLDSGLIIPEGSTMVPIDVLDQIFESDIELHSKEIADYLEEKNIKVTQSEFDALVIYSYNHGSLSEEAMAYLAEGNRNEEDWKGIWTGHDGRKEVCQELFFEGGDEDER